MNIQSENLILVNELDQPVGSETKEKCHEGEGILHRAFSVFIFNSKKELLIQQRSGVKPLWPLTWSNTCCSHPRINEEVKEAADRRLQEEVGLQASIRYVYKFSYKANYEGIGTEHEFCYVFVGQTNEEPRINPDEVNDYKWVGLEELKELIKLTPENFTPWFKMEIRELENNYKNILDRMIPEETYNI